MNQLIAVIGGDARYLELIRKLRLDDRNEVVLVGYDQLEQGFTGLKQIELKDLPAGQLDAVILPIRGTDSEGRAEAVFSDQEIILSKEWFKSLPEQAAVFTGIANAYLTDASADAGLELIPLMNRDDIAIYNSIPTAEGAIMMAIENTDYTIHSARVLVTGYGRVGITIVNKFQALGAHVTAVSRSANELARIAETGVRGVSFEALPEAARDTDILINTVPSRVITEEVIRELPAHALILDLASKPGGTDFDYASQRGIKAILAKSLPGLVAPKTSGSILADVINQHLKEKQKGVTAE